MLEEGDKKPEDEHDGSGIDTDEEQGYGSLRIRMSVKDLDEDQAEPGEVADQGDGQGDLGPSRLRIDDGQVGQDLRAKGKGQKEQPRIEEGARPEHDGRQQAALRGGQSGDHIGDDLVQDGGRRQEEAPVAGDLKEKEKRRFWGGDMFKMCF